ncbi:hypothetical protein P2G85_15090 [Vibrio sp. CAU 1672]|nr:hypothetical protein [Vibrio sp. CAU 1672]
MTINQSVINHEIHMGCCNGEKSCPSKKKTKPIPWFGIVLAALGVLVLVNWH